MKTTLETVCEVYGQQGGTIHGVKEKFETSDYKTQAKVCKALSKVEVSDPSEKQWFSDNVQLPLTRSEIIEIFSNRYGMDITESLRFKIDDHNGNRLAPERFCYKVYFTQFGRRRKLAFWPNTVGYQGF